jgi:hypothetical protein
VRQLALALQQRSTPVEILSLRLVRCLPEPGTTPP